MSQQNQKNAPANTGPVTITGVNPDATIYIGESNEKNILGCGFFEAGIDEIEMPRRGLVFGILTEDGKKEDKLFVISPTAPDDIGTTYFPTVIQVPADEETIVDGQVRGIFIRHRDGAIAGGKCKPADGTCDIKAGAVTIRKR